jgi:hypothetical protein
VYHVRVPAVGNGNASTASQSEHRSTASQHRSLTHSKASTLARMNLYMEEYGWIAALGFHGGHVRFPPSSGSSFHSPLAYV